MKKDSLKMDFLANCSGCGKAFSGEDVFLVCEEEMRTIFHTTCGECLCSSLVFVSDSARGVSGMSLATDLDRDEVKEKFKKGRITADDVMDVYEEMKKNQREPEQFLNK